MLTYKLYKLHILHLCVVNAHSYDTYTSIYMSIVLSLLFLSPPIEVCYFKAILLNMKIVYFSLTFISYKCRSPYEFIGYMFPITSMPLSCTHCGLQFLTHTSIKLLIDIRFEIFTIIIAILMIFFYSSTDLIQFMVVDCIVYTVIKPSHCNLCYIVSVLMSAAILIMFFLWYEFTPHYIFKMDNTVCHSSFHTGEKPIQ